MQQNNSGTQGTNTELKVGMLAMIIGCRQPENRDTLIGKVVTIEALPDVGDNIVEFYDGEHTVIRENHTNIAICYGAEGKARRCTNDGLSTLKDNYTRHNRKYLMPLPPLGDVYDQEMVDEMENTKIYTHN